MCVCLHVCLRELLWTLSDAELNLLEKSLCSTDDVDRSSAMLAELSGLPPELLLSCDAQPFTELYSDDLSDSDDATVSPGIMVHSESTMTVVATQPVTVDPDETSATATVLTDAEARRLQHSKSWPQSADGRRTTHNTSLDGGTTSAVAVYGNQQFNFNLPTNTSTEHLYPDSQAAAAGDRFVEQSIIYLSSPSSSVTDDQQIAYITDELCRIFCTDTASIHDDDDDDDDGDIEVLASSVDRVTLPASTLVDVSSSVHKQWSEMDDVTANMDDVTASVQQQCLEQIPCDCESSVIDDVTASRDSPRLSSKIDDVTASVDDVTASDDVTLLSSKTDDVTAMPSLHINTSRPVTVTQQAGERHVSRQGHKGQISSESHISPEGHSYHEGHISPEGHRGHISPEGHGYHEGHISLEGHGHHEGQIFPEGHGYYKGQISAESRMSPEGHRGHNSCEGHGHHEGHISPEGRGYPDVRSSFMDSPCSSEDSSTLNTDDNVSPPTVSELSSVACDDVEPVVSTSPSEVPCVLKILATSVDSIDNVPESPSAEESCRDTGASVSATSCHTADDSNMTSTSSASGMGQLQVYEYCNSVLINYSFVM